MRLEWIGHACFKMTLESGVKVFTDPYDESVGIAMIPLKADVVTMSHEHHDHNEKSQIIGEPVILRGNEPLALGGLKITARGSYHDDAQGAKRGKNFIRVFEAEGLKIVHMGDQGCMPDEAILDAISGADALLVPVGGFFTIDAAGAKAIIERVNPKCVVPMHVKTKRCPYPIAPVWPFMELMGAKDAQPAAALEWTRDSRPEGVCLMKPMADEL